MTAADGRWFDLRGSPRVSYSYQVKTGKMLQREAEDGDASVPYLKAMHVQADRIAGTDDLPRMWASPEDKLAVGIDVGDLLVCEGGQIGRSALVSEDVPADAIIEKSLHRVRSRGGSLRYLHYLLELVRATGWFEAKSGSATLSHLTGEALDQLRLPLPPHSEQRAIADYLDRETARIDALITAKQTMVDLLNQRLRAAIADRVLGRPVLGASSGPEQVSPRAGWGLIPFRWLFREIDDRSTTGDEELLSVSQTRGVIPQSLLGDRRQYAETLVGYKVCQPGDLVINRMWVYYGALGASGYHGLVSPDYAVFRPINSVTSEFAAYVLRTEAFVGEMTRLVRGIGAAFQGAVRKPRLHPNELGLVALPVPPAAQQTELLDELATEAGHTDQQSALLRKSVGLLREHRQALITAAVTGQIKFR